jgi:ribosomal protein S18 acetylase RimI-like enzyme
VPVIRPYRDDDHAAVHEICIRTADAGQDAGPHYADPDVLPEIFAHPYVRLAPELAFVLDDGGRAVGYVLGTADTARFVRRFRAEWLPLVAGRFPAPDQEPRTPDEVMRHLLHTPERMLVPELADYPAHLHIDLLPQWQGRGGGRALMTSFLRGLHAAGAERVHLGMVPSNTGAKAFYHRLGFHEIPVPDERTVVYLGRDTAI